MADVSRSQYMDSPILGRATIENIIEEEEAGTPLNTPWTFWVDKSVVGMSAAECEASLRKLYTVVTVEGFWRVYNNIPQPSELSNRYSYHLMRGKDRKPLWEDPAHCNGGNWKLKCNKLQANEVWKELLLAAIGEKLSEHVGEEDEIGGVSISVRDRDDIIQIWNTEAKYSEQATITDKVHELLPNVKFITVFYKAFEAHEAFEGGPKHDHTRAF